MSESRKRKKKKKGLLVPKGEDASDTNPLGDARFGSLFTDAAFEVDEASEQYKLLHPSEASSMPSRPDLLMTSDKFNAVNDSEESEVEGRGSDGTSDSDDDIPYKAKSKPKPKKKAKAKATTTVNMLELNEGESYRPGMSRKDLQSESAPKKGKKTFAARLKTEVRAAPKVRDIGGGKEMSFSQSRAKSNAPDDAAPARRDGQRGVGGLGLKKAPKQKYWRGKPV